MFEAQISPQMFFCYTGRGRNTRTKLHEHIYAFNLMNILFFNKTLQIINSCHIVQIYKVNWILG